MRNGDIETWRHRDIATCGHEILRHRDMKNWKFSLNDPAKRALMIKHFYVFHSVPDVLLRFSVQRGHLLRIGGVKKNHGASAIKHCRNGPHSLTQMHLTLFGRHMTRPS